MSSTPARDVFLAAAVLYRLVTGEPRAKLDGDAHAELELFEATRLVEKVRKLRSPVKSSQSVMLLNFARANLAAALDHQRHGELANAEASSLLAKHNIAQATQGLVLSSSPLFVRFVEAGRVLCGGCWNGERADRSGCSRCGGAGFVR